MLFIFSLSYSSDRKRPLDNRRFSDGGPAPKRRGLPDNNKSVFSRLSGKFDDEPKPRLPSHVFKEQPRREDIVAAQGNDEKSKARNRRIFGSLLGTLQKFCQEETKLKSKVEKKAQIEKKLDEKQRREKEMMRKQKQNLLSERRKQQVEIRLIEIKMIKMKELRAWEATKRPLANFIKTKSKPHLYFLPRQLNKKTEERLKKSKEEIERIIEKRTKQVYTDIASLEAKFAEDIKMAEKSGEFEDTKHSDIYIENFGTSDTEVSLIENNIEPIAFESDVEAPSSPYITNSSSVVIIKKEKIDDQESHSSRE